MNINELIYYLRYTYHGNVIGIFLCFYFTYINKKGEYSIMEKSKSIKIIKNVCSVIFTLVNIALILQSYQDGYQKGRADERDDNEHFRQYFLEHCGQELNEKEQD